MTLAVLGHSGFYFQTEKKSLVHAPELAARVICWLV